MPETKYIVFKKLLVEERASVTETMNQLIEDYVKRRQDNAKAMAKTPKRNESD